MYNEPTQSETPPLTLRQRGVRRCRVYSKNIFVNTEHTESRQRGLKPGIKANAKKTSKTRFEEKQENLEKQEDEKYGSGRKTGKI